MAESFGVCVCWVATSARKISAVHAKFNTPLCSFMRMNILNDKSRWLQQKKNIYQSWQYAILLCLEYLELFFFFIRRAPQSGLDAFE